MVNKNVIEKGQVSTLNGKKLEKNNLKPISQLLQPTFKYCTKESSLDLTSSPSASHNERFDEKHLMLQRDGNIGFNSILSRSRRLISQSNVFHFDSHFAHPTDIILKSQNREVLSDLPDQSETAVYSIPRAGISGSVLLPLQQAAGNVDTTSSTHLSIKDMLHSQAKSKPLNMPNKKLSSSQSSQLAVNGLQTSKVCQIRCPSNAVLTRIAKQRPSSAVLTGRQQSILFDSKETNTVDSYLSRTKYSPNDLMPLSSSSKSGCFTSRQQRPKSSNRYRYMIPPVHPSNKTSRTNSKSIGFPSRIVLSNGVATLSQPVADVCIVPEPSLDKIKGVLLSKKLKPVHQEISVKSKQVSARSNGLHKLNVAVKSSTLDRTEQIARNSNSSSSFYDPLGISSACSFCSESMSDCSCKTNSSITATSDGVKSSHSSTNIQSKSCVSKEKRKNKKFKTRPQSSKKDLSQDISLELNKILLLETNKAQNQNQLSPNKSESAVSICSEHAEEASINSECEYEESLTAAFGSEDFYDVEELQDDDAQELCAEACVDDSALTSLEDDCAMSECPELEENSSETSSVFYQHDVCEGRKPALIQSIFSNCPPVINFATHSEQIESFPTSIKKLLKWRMSTITPIVVRNTVFRSGFSPSKKHHDWLGYFGKHMKSSGFRSIREYQKLNHFPGSFQLGRKDRLWRNISRMQTRFGKREFGFVPRSYVLPWDKNLLKAAWEDGKAKHKYILKPPASARGIGIRVIHKWNQIPMKKPILVQKYLSRPYLIDGSKFDLRLYAHVTSFDPLRIYVFNDGLVRFATCKYSSSMKHLHNKYMHLTNYSINKKSGLFKQNDSVTTCQGHKWSLQALWGFMNERGIDTDKIWEQMKDIVIKTIISVEQFTNSLIKSNCRRQACCHELFGLDIMLDDRLKPWLLEVNISPSLHSNSPLDVEIKGEMVKDMFNLCGFAIPDKKLINANAPSQASSSTSATSFSQDKRKQGQKVSQDSRAKHAYFAQHYKSMDENSRSAFLLDHLTVNDVRVLVESEDEASRRGGFHKVFPSTTSKYLRFFEQPRYYNELLHAWEMRYCQQREKGVAQLELFCAKGYHLDESSPPGMTWGANSFDHKIIPSPRVDLKTSAGQALLRSNSIISLPLSATLTLSTNRNRSAKTRKEPPEEVSAKFQLGEAKPET